MRKAAERTGTRESGFTLVEALIAVALFLIVTGAIYGLMRAGTIDQFTANQRAELLQSARISLNTIKRDALNAGFDFVNSAGANTGAVVGDGSFADFRVATDADADPDRLPPVVAKSDLNTNDLSGQLTDQVTFVYIDDTFNTDANGNPQALSVASMNATADVLTLAATPPTGLIRTGDLYVVTGQATTIIGWCTDVNGAQISFQNDPTLDPLGVNTPGAAASVGAPDPTLFGNLTGEDPPTVLTLTPNARLRRVRCVSYLVEADGTMVRRVAGAPGLYDGNLPSAAEAGFIDMPIATGVENLQMQYALSDGTVTDEPTTNQMPLIRQIRVFLQVRSPEVNPQSREPYRTTLSGTLNTRNIGYLR
jgi:type II secretory pathway pseudopilin PulG